MHLRENVGGSFVDLDDNQDADTALNTWYDLYVECDGSNVNVWRGERGQAKTLVLSTSSATDIAMGTNGRFQLFVSDNATYSFDDVRIESAGRRAYTAMYYDAGNRITLSSRAVAGYTPELTDYYYDAWGRLTQRMIDGSTTNYAWRYDHKLYSVTSNIPGEGSATYSYGGDGKRRSRTAGGVTTKYKWGRGWDVVNEEDENGTLQKTYIGHLAEVPGTNPAAGAYAYYATDLIRSTRGLFDANKAQVADYEFTPYGGVFASSGTVSTTHLYTGHDWDSATSLYFAPHRYFSPDVARWMNADPAGRVDGPNVYAYGEGQPASNYDALGLFIAPPGAATAINRAADECECAARDARDEWQKRYPWTADETPRNNFMRHCGCSCTTTKKAGNACAFAAGWANEILGTYAREDVDANDVGRSCGRSAAACEACCRHRWRERPSL